MKISPVAAPVCPTQHNAAAKVWLHSSDHGFRHGRDRRDALHLPGKTSFTEEVVCS
jgi:hypothetical protein